LLGRYALLRLLGSGGMGRVYLAEDRLRGTQVAVKLVSPPPAYLHGGGGRADGKAPLGSYDRFVREARIVRSLNHPAIVRLLDFHEAEGLMVLEYLPGGSLAERAHPLPTPFARRVLLQVLDGLQAAHGAGVVHRDIKPQNIFFTAVEDAKLGDFGVAHLQELGATQTAGFIGTLAYMPPEQISGERLTFAADVYSLGVTAFQMATGRLPFTGPDFVGQHLGEPAPRPSQVAPGCSPAWDELCRRALEKRPEHRFRDLSEMRRAVEALPREVAEGMAPVAGPPGSQPTPEAPSQKTPTASPYHIDAEVSLSRTAHGALFLGNDTRLGRPVIVERFTAGLLQAEAGARHLRWLRVMAQYGGPGLQRVLRIDLGGPEAQVVYEAPVGPLLSMKGDAPLTSREAGLLLRALRGPHEEGVAHGEVLRSVVREEALPLLLLCGRGPLFFSGSGPGPGPEDDRHALSLLQGLSGSEKEQEHRGAELGQEQDQRKQQAHQSQPVSAAIGQLGQAQAPAGEVQAQAGQHQADEGHDAQSAQQEPGDGVGVGRDQHH
jgi:serine/threonine-protein kinase